MCLLRLIRNFFNSGLPVAQLSYSHHWVLIVLFCSPSLSRMWSNPPAGIFQRVIFFFDPIPISIYPSVVSQLEDNPGKLGLKPFNFGFYNPSLMLTSGNYKNEALVQAEAQQICCQILILADGG